MMNNRFRVGEVARLFKLPASTLRYYDEIGLFRPKYTDPETSYRYYGVEQFQILDTIIFLRKRICAVNGEDKSMGVLYKMFYAFY